MRTESSRTHKRDVSEPVLSDATVTSNVDMWWFSQLVGIEEEAIRTDNLDRGCTFEFTAVENQSLTVRVQRTEPPRGEGPLE